MMYYNFLVPLVDTAAVSHSLQPEMSVVENIQETASVLEQQQVSVENMEVMQEKEHLTSEQNLTPAKGKHKKSCNI